MSDIATGWEFEGTLDSSGYVIREVMHNQHQLAQEIKIERVIVAAGHIGGPLSAEDFRLGDVSLVSPPTLTNPVRQTGPLGYYTPKLAVTTVYEKAGLFGEASEKITLTQSFLFTDYGANPSHEPSGLLKAGRLFPLLEFSVPPSPVSAQLDNRITAIKVVYRLDLAVGGKTTVNQSGMWKDLDTAGELTTVIPRIVRDITPGGSTRAGRYAFSGAEKPLMYEVAAHGLSEGRGGDWDNIHQWNGDSPSNVPWAPGMPYAAHLHWRWATVAYEGLVFRLKGGKQFGGPGGAGKPLLDQRIPDQALHFAVTVREPSSVYFAHDARRLFTEFDNLFAWSKPTPTAIDKGAELTTWVAVTVHDPAYHSGTFGAGPRTFAGTVFAHGLFFAHEAKAPPRLPPGSKGPQYIPSRPTQKWAR